jgi:hypothetical protein
MNFIAGLLMLEIPEYDAFCVFSWILRQLHLDTFFEGQGIGLLVYADIFEGVVKQHLPR